jgi:DNA-binding NtrC family response regulator
MAETNRTILIVDDEASVRQSFYDYFEDRLWRPLQAESGERALEILEQESPCCVIVDIRMGGMDGNTFIREAVLKKPETAFVICTGSPEYDIPADLLKLPGVSNHIFKKPVTQMKKLEDAFLRPIPSGEAKGT